MRDQCAAYILHLMRAYIENIALPIHTAHTHSTHTHTHTPAASVSWNLCLASKCTHKERSSGMSNGAALKHASVSVVTPCRCKWISGYEV